MKTIGTAAVRRRIPYGVSSARTRWVLGGTLLAIVALNGWMISLLGPDLPVMLFGDEDSLVSMRSVILGAQAVSAAITTVSLLAVWRWSWRTGSYFRESKPVRYWIDAALLAVLFVLLGVIFIFVK